MPGFSGTREEQMNRYLRKYMALSAVALMLTAGCAPAFVEKKDLNLGPVESRWINKTLKRMTLREKIGQMVAFACTGRFYGVEDEEYRRLEDLVRIHKIGGLIVFGGDVFATAFLTNRFQEMAEIPLIFASDLERGLGTQLDRTVLFPPFMALGAAGSEEFAYTMGRITAEEGRAVGIHMTYAPVVDVNINPENPIINTRSLGENPEKVGHLAAAFIRGCQENGLIATAKHFPGHGDTALDSHTVLPTIPGDRSRLDRVELLPFRMAVDAGVKAVMVSHLFVPGLDPTAGLPATLSKTILTGILREEMGFRGLIVTDSMRMGGLDSFSHEEAAVRAVMAGVDMLLIPPEPEKAIEALLAAVRTEKISEGRVDSSVLKILKAKASLGLNRNRYIHPELLPGLISKKSNLKEAKKLLEHSMTLVQNRGNVLPLKKNGRKIGILSLSSDPGGYYAGRTFVRSFQSRMPEAWAFFAEPTTDDAYLSEAKKKASEMDCVIMALFSRRTAGKGTVGLYEKHTALVKDLAEGDVPTIVISFGSPYFLMDFPDVDGYLCAYRYSDEAQTTAAAALFGEIFIRGRLPVSLPGIYPAGHGIELQPVSGDEADNLQKK